MIATILFSLSLVLLVIGIHQTMLNGFSESYWIFSFSAGAFLAFAYLKRNQNVGEQVAEQYQKKTGKNLVTPSKKQKNKR